MERDKLETLRWIGLGKGTTVIAVECVRLALYSVVDLSPLQEPGRAVQE